MKKIFVLISMSLLLVSSLFVINKKDKIEFTKEFINENLIAQQSLDNDFLDMITMKVYGNSVDLRDYFGLSYSDNGYIFLNNKPGEFISTKGDQAINMHDALDSSTYVVEFTINNPEGRSVLLSRNIETRAKKIDVRLYDYEQGANATLHKMDISQDGVKTHTAESALYSSRSTSAPRFNVGISQLKPAISGKDSIINNIDNPYTLEEIKRIADITATDEYYGNITSSVEIKTENYIGNEKKLGTFQITYSVSNMSGLTSDYTLNVLNKDLAAPTIKGISEKTISYTEVFNPNEITPLLTATDNYDKNVQVVYNNEIDNGYGANKIGNFVFQYYAEDSSKNRTIHNFTLRVKDDKAPLFISEHEGVIHLNYKDTFTDSKLLLGLSVEDEIDGKIPNSRINIVDTGGLKNKVGSYIIKYSASDIAGNTAYHEQEFKVITTDAPEFWVSRKIINIEDVNSLSTKQIIDIIASYENISYVSYLILEDEYSTNEATPGNYNIRVAFTDSSGLVTEHSRMMSVFSSDDLNTEVDSFWYKLKNFFNKVWNGIKTVFNFIWKVVTAPFKWLGKLLGIGKTKSIVVTRFRL